MQEFSLQQKWDQLAKKCWCQSCLERTVLRVRTPMYQYTICTHSIEREHEGGIWKNIPMADESCPLSRIFHDVFGGHRTTTLYNDNCVMRS